MSFKLSLADIEKIYGISAGTLRYYDRLGLVPWFQRLPSGERYIDLADYGNIELIDLLKKCGFPLSSIKKFSRLITDALEHGENAVSDFQKCVNGLEQHCDDLIQQLSEISKQLELTRFVKWYMEEGCKAGTCMVHMSENPPQYQRPLPEHLPDYMTGLTFNVKLEHNLPVLAEPAEEALDIMALTIHAVREKYPTYKIPDDLLKKYLE